MLTFIIVMIIGGLIGFAIDEMLAKARGRNMSDVEAERLTKDLFKEDTKKK